MSTIYDVAQRAGVSISTVSLALNSPGRVKPTTLERVLAAADELGYVPKAEAMTRARRGVGRIGVVAPFTSYPSFAERLNGVLKATRHSPWEIVLYDQESVAVTPPTVNSVPLTRRLDGLVIMALPIDDKAADRLRRQQLPTVLVEVERTGFTCITIDDAAGGKLAAEHLLRRGHKRFAFIAEEMIAERETFHRDQILADARRTGFRDTLAAAGHALPDGRVRLVSLHDAAHARAAAHELLDLSEPPSAIFTHDDVLASGVLQAARDRNLRVPDELAVVGFDDCSIAEPLGLTTIRQPLEESGEVAVRTLMDQIAHPNRSLQHVALELSLVIRETA